MEGRRSVYSHKSFDISNIRITLGRFTLHIVSQNACKYFYVLCEADESWAVDEKNKKSTHLRDGTIDILIKPVDPETRNQSRQMIHIEHQSHWVRIVRTMRMREGGKEYETNRKIFNTPMRRLQ